MKKIFYKSIGAILFSGSLIITGTALAQRVEVSSTTTTSAGTISEFGPQALVIKTEAGTQPVRYLSRETTNYVDEDGNPVSLTTVKSGLPVTVYYTKVGDTLVASKVIVKKSLAAPTRAVETTETTTTSAGTISEFGPQALVIKSETSAEPIQYTSSKTTTYVDETGAPVSITTVKSGLPVTVYYTKVGDKMVATKVIVRKSTTVPPPVIEEKRTTTTTTERRK